MISYEEALKKVLDNVHTLRPERLPVLESTGQVVAQEGPEDGEALVSLGRREAEPGELFPGEFLGQAQEFKDPGVKGQQRAGRAPAAGAADHPALGDAEIKGRLRLPAALAAGLPMGTVAS